MKTLLLGTLLFLAGCMDIAQGVAQGLVGVAPYAGAALSSHEAFMRDANQQQATQAMLNNQAGQARAYENQQRYQQQVQQRQRQSEQSLRNGAAGRW